MATWTKIPETRISATLGAAAGKVAGSISKAANKELDLIESEIEILQRDSDSVSKNVRLIQDNVKVQALDPDQASNIEKISRDAKTQIKTLVTGSNKKTKASVAQINATLNATEASLKALLTPINMMETLAKTLKIPLPALLILINVIKVLPLPQIYLVVAFTTIESDLLEMLTELIKQAEEEISGLEMTATALKGVLQPVLDRIERIRASIALLGAESELLDASDKDQDVLDEAGLLDKNSGENLFTKIQEGLADGVGGTATYGLDSDIDLTTPEVGNQITLGEPGDFITVSQPVSGSWIDTWYHFGLEEPTVPERFPETLEEWFKPTGSIAAGTDLWKLDCKYSGNLLYEVGIPEYLGNQGLEYEDRDENSGSSKKILILGPENYAEKPGILKIDNWSDFLEGVLDKLRTLPLSQELKDNLDNYWNYQVTSLKVDKENEGNSLTESDFQYLSHNGELYTIEIVEDQHSPRVAIRRYARVKDSQGTVILDGIKTFSTNAPTLLQEIKLQLDQLTR